MSNQIGAGAPPESLPAIPAHTIRSRVGRAVAAQVPARATGWRKVRAPADRVPGNAWGARAHGKCNREQTAQVPHGTGKGETVR